MLCYLFLVVSTLAQVPCPNGWEFFPSTKKCFYFKFKTNAHAKSYWGAQHVCEKLGATLPTIDNKEENSFIAKYLSHSVKRAWIGLYNNSNHWEWLEDENGNISYVNWYLGSPQVEFGDSGDGAYIVPRSGKWKILAERFKLPFVCSKPPPTTPKLNYFCDDGWSLFSPTASCYQIGRNASFQRAMSSCKQREAQLVTIHSSDENTFIRKMARSGDQHVGLTSQIWIGLTRLNGTWKNLDRTHVNYTNWIDGHPQNGFDCAALIGDSFNCSHCLRDRWMSANCSTVMRAFVCEKSAHSLFANS